MYGEKTKKKISFSHPFHGSLSMSDMKLKIATSLQSTERGRKVNAAMVNTGKAVGRWCFNLLCHTSLIKSINRIDSIASHPQALESKIKNNIELSTEIKINALSPDWSNLHVSIFIRLALALCFIDIFWCLVEYNVCWVFDQISWTFVALGKPVSLRLQSCNHKMYLQVKNIPISWNGLIQWTSR